MVNGRKRLAYWLTRVLARTPSHCAIGTSTYVLDPNVCGDRLCDAKRYVLAYPGLTAMIVVPWDGDLVADMRPPSIALAVLRWLSLGFVPARDCVSTVADTLRRGGVHVPRRIVTPRQLWRHLVQSGHYAHPLV